MRESEALYRVSWRKRPREERTDSSHDHYEYHDYDDDHGNNLLHRHHQQQQHPLIYHQLNNHYTNTQQNTRDNTLNPTENTHQNHGAAIEQFFRLQNAS